MRGMWLLLGAAAVAATTLLGGRPADAGADPQEVWAAAKEAVPVLAEARKKAPGDADTVKTLKDVRAKLEPFAGDVRAAHWDSEKGDPQPGYAKVWNEYVTLAAYHGADTKAEYVLDRTSILGEKLWIGLPAGGQWSKEANRDSKTSDQLRLLIFQRRADGKTVRRINLWVYRWDTVYSGVGGENYKKLARVMHELDRDSTAKSGRKASGSVQPKRLNAEFDRAYYYYVEGFDVDEEKNLRRDNYYVKGDNLTVNFEVITYTDALEDDDAVTEWQRTEGDREIGAVLGSIAGVAGKKK